jgi:thiol:disulfide interchange protein DsbD
MRLVLWLVFCLVVPASNAEGFLDRLPSFGGNKQPTFLPPDKAFSLDIKVRDAQTLEANYSVTPGYYLYRDKITFASTDNEVKVTAVNLPKGEIKHDATFGDTEVFHQSFPAQITLNRPSNSAAISITLNAVYQGCSDQGLCYPLPRRFRSICPA